MLEKNSPQFVIQTDFLNKKNYGFEIVTANLYVPVAQLVTSVYRELSTIMSRKHDPKPVALHFRRIEIAPLTVPVNIKVYNSPSLFPNADLPCKCIFFLVEAESWTGNHHKNPFKL